MPLTQDPPGASTCPFEFDRLAIFRNSHLRVAVRNFFCMSLHDGVHPRRSSPSLPGASVCHGSEEQVIGPDQGRRFRVLRSGVGSCAGSRSSTDPVSMTAMATSRLVATAFHGKDEPAKWQ